MSDEQLDLLSKLAAVNPDLATMVAEYQRLADSTQNQSCRDWLLLMVRGWLSVADQDPDGTMWPLVFEGGTTYKGYENVRDISIVKVTYADGEKQNFSVWQSRSFAHRLGFLANGRMALGYVGPNVYPLCMSLGLNELGINIDD